MKLNRLTLIPSWQCTITKADNGFVVTSPTHLDDKSVRIDRTVIKENEYKEYGESIAMRELLYHISNYFDCHNGRIEIKILNNEEEEVVVND